MLAAALLEPLSWIYALGARAAALPWDRGWRRPQRLPRPVVSVGNLAVGGTGKTPFVLHLLELCRRLGLRPAVLARGYRRERGERLNDEGRLIARRWPEVPQEQDPDRVRAGRRLLARAEPDLLLLDDGFQHRRLHRDLDLVLLDAQDPLAGGRCLPAGPLREPPAALARADVLVLVGQAAEPVQHASLRAFGKPILQYRVVPWDVVREPGGTRLPLESLAGRRVFVLAAIARPERVVATLEGAGAVVAGRRFLRDHAPLPASLLEAAAAAARRVGAALVSTEKDEARLARRGFGGGPERYVLRIRLEGVGAADRDLERRLRALEGRREDRA